MEKKEKKTAGNWIVRNLLGAVALILTLTIASGVVLKFITHHNQEIAVPDFTNLSPEQASALALKEGVRIEVIDSVYVRRMSRGAVYRQTPSAGSSVKQGRRVLLTINAVTPKKVKMPNLVGCPMRQAKAELLSRGLKLGKLIYVNDMATNNVLRQLMGNVEIRPGRLVESETEINLVVGLNASDCMTSVPNVVGLKNLSAVDAIHDYSLNVRNLSFDASVKNYADSLNAVVYRQSPPYSDVPCNIGSDVTLYLSIDPSKIASK